MKDFLDAAADIAVIIIAVANVVLAVCAVMGICKGKELIDKGKLLWFDGEESVKNFSSLIKILWCDYEDRGQPGIEAHREKIAKKAKERQKSKAAL